MADISDSLLEKYASTGDIVRAPVICINEKTFNRMVDELSVSMSQEYPRIGYVAGETRTATIDENPENPSKIVFTRLKQLFVPDQIYHDPHDINRTPAPYRLRVTDEGHASTIAEIAENNLDVVAVMLYEGKLSLANPEAMIRRTKQKLLDNGLDIPAEISASPGHQKIRVPYEFHVEPEGLFEIVRY